MSDIKEWSNDSGVAPATSATVPDYMPEGSTPIASVNNWGREAQAAIRRFYESFEWRNYGFTVAYASNTTVDVQTGKGVMYGVGQRVTLDVAAASSPQYGTITNISTDVLTIDIDGGAAIAAATDTILVGVNAENYPIDQSAVYGLAEVHSVMDAQILDRQYKVDGDSITATFASTTTFTVAAADRHSFWLDQAITITDTGSAASGVVTNIAFGTVEDEDDATITIVEDTAQNLTAGLTAVEATTATEDNIAIFDGYGQTKDGGAALADLVEHFIFDADRATQGHIAVRVTATTGIMLQWGYTSSGSVSFAPDFSATVYSVVGTTDKTSTTDAGLTVSGESKFGCSFHIPGGNGAFWLAVGPCALPLP